MKFAEYLILVITFVGIGMLSQSSPKPDSKNGGNMLSTNQCVAKGGIGIVNAHLYVDLKSEKNELILDGGNRWVGQSPRTSELVFFFEDRVFSAAAVPERFDLSKAIVISFEGSIVRFFDFGKMSGGYYKRSTV